MATVRLNRQYETVGGVGRFSISAMDARDLPSTRRHTIVYYQRSLASKNHVLPTFICGSRPFSDYFCCCC